MDDGEDTDRLILDLVPKCSGCSEMSDRNASKAFSKDATEEMPAGYRPASINSMSFLRS